MNRWARRWGGLAVTLAAAAGLIVSQALLMLGPGRRAAGQAAASPVASPRSRDDLPAADASARSPRYEAMRERLAARREARRARVLGRAAAIEGMAGDVAAAGLATEAADADLADEAADADPAGEQAAAAAATSPPAPFVGPPGDAPAVASARPAVPRRPARSVRAPASDASPPADPALAHMDRAYRLKAAGDLAGAAAALEAARAAGFDPQRTDAEAGYVALARGDLAGARARLASAARGPDPALASAASRELAHPPRALSFELYSDAVAWRRLSGAGGSDAVPTLRLRARLRPWLDRGLLLYAYAQASRDLASLGLDGGPASYHADGYALFGAGALLQLWGGRAGLFAQAGPAVNTRDDGRDAVALDARAGAFLGLEGARCRARTAGSPCAELYAETVGVSRPAPDLFALARGRAGLTWLVTGPVAWGPVAELRVAGEAREPWRSIVSAGAGHRWRLLAPFGADLLLTFQTGRHLAARPDGRAAAFADLRLEAATFVEF